MKKIKNTTMCKCGHEYAYHVNPRTKVEDGCIFSYNCDCEGFQPLESEVNHDNAKKGPSRNSDQQ